MAMECKRCGGPAMSETVIRLRRGILGLRETRVQGVYCTACKVSSTMENPASTRPLIAISDNRGQKLGGMLPMKLGIRVSAPVRAY
jgi:hypothetical protein